MAMAQCRRGLASRSRLLSLFGVESSAPFLNRVIVWQQCVEQCLIIVRHRQPRPGPLTSKVLALENVASWAQHKLPDDRSKKMTFDVLPRKSKLQRARELVDAVLPLPDCKEEIFAACDTWVAWELGFPLHTVKMATHRLFRLKQWRRVIHVIKWMFSKGHGFSMNTFGCLIRALDIDGRLEEVEHIWDSMVVKKQECVPRVMYARMITMYERRGLPDKAIRMYRDMELSGTRPDPRTIIRIGKIYENLGFPNKTAEILEKHKPVKRFVPFKIREKMRRQKAPIQTPETRRRLTGSQKRERKKLKVRLARVIDYS